MASKYTMFRPLEFNMESQQPFIANLRKISGRKIKKIEKTGC